jgi:hypothetical protein
MTAVASGAGWCHCEGTCNLVMLCGRHHHVLHRPGWHAKLLPDTTLHVTNPHGHTRTTGPPDPSRAPQLPLAS